MSMRITELDADNEWGWNHETGALGTALFSNAVQVWTVAQGREVTVSDTALAFNVEPKLIRQAVEDHPWMFIGKDEVIEHEGE